MYEAETVSCKRSLIAVGSLPVQKILVSYGQGQSFSYRKQLALAHDVVCVLQGHHEDPELASTVRVS